MGRHPAGCRPIWLSGGRRCPAHHQPGTDPRPPPNRHGRPGRHQAGTDPPPALKQARTPRPPSSRHGSPGHHQAGTGTPPATKQARTPRRHQAGTDPPPAVKQARIPRPPSGGCGRPARRQAGADVPPPLLVLWQCARAAGGRPGAIGYGDRRLGSQVGERGAGRLGVPGHEAGIGTCLHGEHHAKRQLGPVAAGRPPQGGQPVRPAAAGERRGQPDAAPQIGLPLAGEPPHGGLDTGNVRAADEPQRAADALIDRTEEVIGRALPGIGGGDPLRVDPATGVEVGAVEPVAVDGQPAHDRVVLAAVKLWDDLLPQRPWQPRHGKAYADVGEEDVRPARPEQQVASAVAAAPHRVEDGAGHRGALIGEAERPGLDQAQPPLHLPLIARLDAPFKATDHSLRDRLELLGRGWIPGREPAFGEGHIRQRRGQHGPAQRATDRRHVVLPAGCYSNAFLIRCRHSSYPGTGPAGPRSTSIASSVTAAASSTDIAQYTRTAISVCGVTSPASSRAFAANAAPCAASGRYSPASSAISLTSPASTPPAYTLASAAPLHRSPRLEAAKPSIMLATARTSEPLTNHSARPMP